MANWAQTKGPERSGGAGPEHDAVCHCGCFEIICGTKLVIEMTNGHKDTQNYEQETKRQYYQVKTLPPADFLLHWRFKSTR